MDRELGKFIRECDTHPAPKDDSENYLPYWYKAVACTLLSDRVKATDKLSPNKTDMVCWVCLSNSDG